MITAIELDTEWQQLLLDAVALGPHTSTISTIGWYDEPIDTIPKRMVAESLLHFTHKLYGYLLSEGIECVSYCPLEVRLSQCIHLSIGMPPTKLDACYLSLAIQPRLGVLGRAALTLCTPMCGGWYCRDIEGVMDAIRREQGIINRYHRLHEGKPSCGSCHYVSGVGGFCGLGQDMYAGGCDQHQRWDSV